MKAKAKTKNDLPAIEWTEQEVAVADLKPYERNPRKISKESYAALLAAVQKLGYHQRITAQQDRRVIGGHQRIRVLRELGFERVKVLTPSRPLTEDEYRQLLVQDNLPFGEFDFDRLSADFDAAELIDWNMPEEWLTGAKVAEEGLTDPDDVPEAPLDPVSAPGDVWALGGHRLACGDSTKAEDVAALLAGAKPHLMVTDPPYGVEYDAKARRSLQSKNCNPAQGIVTNDNRADWQAAWDLYDGDVAYVWHAGTQAHIVADSLLRSGFEIRAQIIWSKTKFVIGRGHYHVQHEPCFYAVRGTGHWCGDRTQSTLWEIAHRKSETGHSTQKPVECMKRPIENNSKPGDAVYEPFSGSGTTIIAAEMTGRKCFAMEISPAYDDLAVQRWQAFTGQEATHAETGETFNSRISIPAARQADAGRVEAGA